MVLSSHKYQRTSHENQCQTCKCVYGSITMCCVDSDDFEVERHRHKDQAGERDCACPDQKEEIIPFPRPKDIGCNHGLIITRCISSGLSLTLSGLTPNVRTWIAAGEVGRDYSCDEKVRPGLRRVSIVNTPR